jgi:fibronectin type 3 domain-containing protein
LAAAVFALPTPARPEAPNWAEHPENQWVKQSPREGKSVPRFSWEGSGDYDPYHKKWIHHAGHDGIPQGFHLFTFDLATGAWEQLFPNTSPPGVCCVDGAHVFDLADRHFVRFPGGSLGHGFQWSRGVKLKNSAVWLYDLDSNTWTNMRPPPYRQPLNARDWFGYLNAGAAYDPNHELAISFGGQGNAGGTNNLFVYDAYANALQKLDAANPPSPRDGMGITYDASNDCLILFGSQYASDEKTWISRYPTNRWEAHELNPHPPGKKLGTYSTIPRLAYDSANGVTVCLTWDTNTNKHETWALDAGQLRWTKMNPATEPDASMSRSRNLSYSREHNLFILELVAKDDKAAQIWTYRYKKAPADPRPASPANLQVETAAGMATLTWQAGAPGTKEYRVYRAAQKDPWQTQFEKVAVVRDTRFEDKSLAAGQVYRYVVKAVAGDDTESRASFQARTQPRVPSQPVVSVLDHARVEVSWKAVPARDVAGYNVYRGLASIRTVKKGVLAAWKDNDPEYAEPLPVEVRDITQLRKLNDQPLNGTSFSDTIDLTQKGPESGDYRYAVYAYVVRAVNRLGTESGPSPYALTLASAPMHVLNREQGQTAELKWDANPEKKIVGYHVYKLDGTWGIVRITKEPVQATTFRHAGGNNPTRYWIVPVDALGQEGEPSSPVWHHHGYPGFFQGEWHQ